MGEDRIDRLSLEAFCTAGELSLPCFSFFPYFRRKAVSPTAAEGEVFLFDGFTVGGKRKPPKYKWFKALVSKNNPTLVTPVQWTGTLGGE